MGGFYLFNAGVISMGAIIAVVMLASRSLAPVGQLAFLMTRGRQAFVTLNSLQTLMDQDDEREKGSRSITPEVREGHLQFEHVGSNRPLHIPELDQDQTGLKVTVFLEVEGAAHYLPAYAGNLDIMTSAALRTAEKIATRMAGKVPA